MKSQLDTVLTIYDNIFQDVTARWPETTSSIRKDYSYLRRAVQMRGLSFATLVLPAAGKAFDRSLSERHLVTEEFPLGFPKVREDRETFLSGLLSKVFDIGSGTMLPDPDCDAIFFLRQIFYCFKKYRLACPIHLVAKAYRNFFKTEEAMPPPYPNSFGSWDPKWVPLYGHPLQGDTSEGQSNDDYRWILLRYVSGVVVSSLGSLPWHELKGRHGPGVVAERHKGSKYELPNWPLRLGDLFPYEYYGSGIIDDGHNYTQVEQASRLLAVPKTQKGPRLICAEPLAHQWIQQSIWSWLRRQVPVSMIRNTVTFGCQENSRNRALHASIDGSLATVDLSEASDRLSARLVHYIFQSHRDLLDAMWACRTNYLVQNDFSEFPNGISLNKFAPMGSALTFPIQSIVFSCIAIAAVMLNEDQPMTTKAVREAADRVTVFGDDIIIPTPAFDHLVSYLTDCGLKVNTDKSFYKGNFRESCGMDAFDGVDVTPAYYLQPYDGSAEAMATTIECSNNFFKKGLWNTAQSIVRELPHKERKLLMVTGPDLDGLGLFSYCGSSSKHLKKEYDEDLQREYSIGLHLDTQLRRVRGQDMADLTQYFIEDPASTPLLLKKQWEGGYVSRRVIRKERGRVS